VHGGRRVGWFRCDSKVCRDGTDAVGLQAHCHVWRTIWAMCQGVTTNSLGGRSTTAQYWLVARMRHCMSLDTLLKVRASHFKLRSKNTAHLHDVLQRCRC
jgi:hypothetical protein